MITSSQRTRHSVGHAYGADAKRIAVSPKGVNTSALTLEQHLCVVAMSITRLAQWSCGDCIEAQIAVAGTAKQGGYQLKQTH